MLVGCIFAPLVIVLFAAAIIIHMIFLYKGIKELAELKSEPIWIFSVLLIVWTGVILIMCGSVIGGMLNDFVSMISIGVEDITNDILDTLM